MKRLAHNILMLSFALVGLALIPGRVLAQQGSFGANAGYVAAYIDAPETLRSSLWWNELEAQISLPTDLTYDEITVSQLQHIIFFATNHAEKVDLKDSAPLLLEVYSNHEQEPYRLMALAALSAIGDAGSMATLRDLADSQPSERIQRLTKSAVTKYFESIAS
jgi:hypothetical protein